MGDQVFELETLWDEVRKCSDCFRIGEKTYTVVGTGQLKPMVMTIGFYPRPECGHTDREKVIGQPYITTYEKMLHAIGLTWEQVWCTNCVKCIGRRGPGNPLTCKKFLDREVKLIEPKLIVVIGEQAFHTLMNDEEKLMQWIPNKEYMLDGTRVITMVSPEAITQNPRYERYWKNASGIIKQYMKQPTLEWW